MTPDHQIVIVVPIYGDLPSLLRCVDALIAQIRPAEHRVLLVNDCGPEADEIEAAILARIEGTAGFRYERNEKNLGFVGTCNRAVLELDTSGDTVLLLNSDTVPTEGFLDAMVTVLFAEDRVGVVTARSNNATIASIPYRLTNRGAARTPDRTKEVWAGVTSYLPEAQAVPVAMGFCFMTRRALVDQHGLFDEEFAPGYGEENDYCLRIARDGWTARIANRALVFHEGSMSFSGNRKSLRDAHQRELERRYPHLPAAVSSYQRFGVTGAERFADCLIPTTAPERVAVDSDSTLDAVAATLSSMRFEVERATREGQANEDDLVVATVLHRPTSTKILEANRRSLVVIVVDDTAPCRWDDPRDRSGVRLLEAVGAAKGLHVVAPDEVRSIPAILREALDAPTGDRVKRLEERWRLLLAVEAVADDVRAMAATPADDREVRRLQQSLEELRTSKSYRLGNRVVRIANRLRGNR